MVVTGNLKNSEQLAKESGLSAALIPRSICSGMNFELQIVEATGTGYPLFPDSVRSRESC